MSALHMDQMAPTRILREEWEILPRLVYLQLDKARLLEVRAIAIGAAADATPFHPANAPGTLSYHHGTFGLRDRFVGDVWMIDRTNGVEGIRNGVRRTKVVFANVDISCDDVHAPQPRSAKGSGAERLCAGNGLFDSMPSYFPATEIAEPGWTVYYLMIAPNGAAELSCPVVFGGTFKYFVERIYLSDGSDLKLDPDVSLDDDDAADDFDPQVARKQ